MATLFIICGLPSAGKTTVAKKMERERSSVRLCPDEWIWTILPPDFTDEERDRLREPVQSIQWDVAERLLTLGVDVILEWGTWERAERAGLRDRARELGAAVELHYLDVQYEELVKRVMKRNSEQPDNAFLVSLDELEEWHGMFEPPGPDELATYDDYVIR
ncbi:MAG: ATP-binding protein [Thermomicrobiales bacterium]